MQEIGSNFEFRFNLLNQDKEFNILDYFNFTKEYNLYLSNGRATLKYILSYYLNGRKNHFLLPSYLCDAVLQPFNELGLNIDFYKINSDLSINLKDLVSKIKSNTSAILLIHYFGFPQPKKVMNKMIEFKHSGIKIIEDMTHALFTKSINSQIGQIGNYIIISLRKWFSIPDGSLLFADHKLDTSVLNTGYNSFSFKNIVGQFLKKYYLKEKDLKKDLFLQLFKEAEDYFNKSISLDLMTEISKKLLKKINYSRIIERRKDNYSYLFSHMDNISNVAPFFNEFPKGVCPLGFPIVTEQRNELKKHLIKNKIYPPVHWRLPKKINTQNHKISTKISNNILTIPCDQRYSIKEMRYIIDKLSNFKSKI